MGGENHPDFDVLGVKQDSLVLLVRQTNHALNNMSMRVDRIAGTLTEVQLATTRLEQANTAAQISELKANTAADFAKMEAEQKAADLRIASLERDQTKKAGLAEFARFITSMLPWFAIIAAAFAWYVSTTPRITP